MARQWMLVVVGAVMVGCATGPVPARTIERTPVSGISRTPTGMCVVGTQRAVETVGKRTLPSDRYCTDTDWNVRDVAHDGVNVYWTVPFTDGSVSCACRMR